MPKGVYPRRIIPAEDRLMAMVMPITECGCWIFLGCLNDKGYGDFSIATGNHQLAHRVSYELFKGEIPDGSFVLHSCDIPCCINPDHLRLGTQKDNMEDCSRKGRIGTTGIKNPISKLTEDDVRAIRLAPGKLDDIAEKFGVAVSNISQIKNGHTWKHVK